MKFKITRQTMIEESCILDADTAEQAENLVSNADYKDVRRVCTVEVEEARETTATGISG